MAFDKAVKEDALVAAARHPVSGRQVRSVVLRPKPGWLAATGKIRAKERVEGSDRVAPSRCGCAVRGDLRSTVLQNRVRQRRAA